jgi:hypothetical protein
MIKRIYDVVLKTNFKRSILDEQKNVNIENQIGKLLSNFNFSHFESLISQSSC